MLHWVLRPWRLMFDFRGRATRREYWFFLVQLYAVLTIWAMLVALTMEFAFKGRSADSVLPVLIIGLLVLLLIPYLSASIRRIHDHDKSGWMFLLTIVPIVGWIFYLILMLTPGTQGPNTYGNDPRDRLDSNGDVSEIFS